MLEHISLFMAREGGDACETPWGDLRFFWEEKGEQQFF
jgi:hypothetical protein